MKATERDTPRSQRSSSPSREGRALRPPSYGIDVLDREPAGAPIQLRRADSSAISATSRRSGPGQPLPVELERNLESMSGLSLADVRVHYGSPQPQRLRALAYTRGSDIHVGPGQERHLAHEAWHAVQQKQGRVRPSVRSMGFAIATDRGLEREADVMGARAERGVSTGGPSPMRSGSPTMAGSPSTTVQLLSKGDFVTLAQYGLDVATWPEFEAALAKLSARFVLNAISAELMRLRTSGSGVAVQDLESAYEFVAARNRQLAPPPRSAILDHYFPPTNPSAIAIAPTPLLAPAPLSAPPLPMAEPSVTITVPAAAASVGSGGSGSSGVGPMSLSSLSLGGMGLGGMGLAAPPPRPRAVDKVALARRIQLVLGDLPTFLSGGGAATLLGGPRAIKDLDFRVGMPADRTFRTDDVLSQGLIDGMNEFFEREFGVDQVERMTRSDPVTGMTIAGTIMGVEVSFTRTPTVEYMGIGVGPSGVRHLGEFDVLLDKAYSFVMRRSGDFDKKVTDLIDILAMIAPQEGRIAVLSGLDQLRGTAYAAQVASAAQRSATDYEPSLLVEFSAQLEEFMDGQRGNLVVRKMKELGAGHLIPLIRVLKREVGRRSDRPGAVTVL